VRSVEEKGICFSFSDDMWALYVIVMMANLELYQTLWNYRSTVELLHGEISWICSSGVIFAELELSQTRLE
jgi:hypothetical protein